MLKRKLIILLNFDPELHDILGEVEAEERLSKIGGINKLIHFLVS